MKTTRTGGVYVATQDHLIKVAATRGEALRELAEQIFKHHTLKTKSVHTQKELAE